MVDWAEFFAGSYLPGTCFQFTSRPISFCMNMKLKILAFITIVAMSAANPANAGFFTGGKLLPLCESGSASKNHACEMYLVGITDAHDGVHRLGGLSREYFCLSQGISLPQMREIFIKYANRNPQYLPLPASRLAIGAFAEAFPCK